MTMEEMKIKEEYVTPGNMIYARRTGAYGPENGILMESFKAWISEHGFMKEDSVILGIAWDNAAVVAPDQCRYDVCLLGDYHAQEEWIAGGEAPAGNYLVIELPHTAEAVGYVWQNAIPYLLANGYIPDTSRPIVERYKKCLVDQGLCEMMIPISS